jgi:hypothetical protein
VPSADRSVAHALESIGGCMELRQLQQTNLDQWIATQPKP